jgi:ribonucleoside-diphosphate reductase alpha chain
MTKTIFVDDFSREVWETTYKHSEEASIDDTFKRVAKAVASVETEELKAQWEANFYELLSEFKMSAGGRILANAGTKRKGTTLMNCFTGPKPIYDQDSIDGIYQTLVWQAQTLKSEGGWGMNFSFIRPRGAYIHGVGVESPGPVKFMELFDKSSDVITAGSGKKSTQKGAKEKIRKGAMMGILGCWHPSIEEFITAKLTPNRLSRFNLSVDCVDEFMEKIIKIKKYKDLKANAVSKDEEDSSQIMIDALDSWDLIFPDTQHPAYHAEWDGDIQLWKSKGYPVNIYKTISAWGLWNLIMTSTYTRNDPGVLFLDRANKTHCYYYGGSTSRITATNPCGEQCMPVGSVCNLASICLTQFIDEESRSFDFIKLKKYVPWAVRFLDNVNDLANAPLQQYRESVKTRRRIGLGVMGWASALYMLKIKFGSDEAEALKKELMKTICYSAIQASVDLAKEKGMFQNCQPEKHAEAFFFEQIELPEQIKNEIRKYGIRNSSLFSIQPTGNTGILANIVSGGIEPVFCHEYTRTVIVTNCPDNLKPICPKFWEGEFKETSVFKFAVENGEQILKAVVDGVVYKIDHHRGLTKEVPCIDYGVRYLMKKNEWDSSAPYAVTSSQLSAQEHVKDLKGFGRWIDSSISKTVNLPKDYSMSSFIDVYLDAYNSGVLKGITTYRDGTMITVLSENKTQETKDQEKPSGKIFKTTAPKRPEELPAELHHVTLDGKLYYVAVGLLDSDPYEVFVGTNTKNFIPKTFKKGVILKHRRGVYSFVNRELEQSYELNNGHSNDAANALTRLISTALRHGTDISLIVHQLEKSEGSIMSFSKVLARTLKKYIKDGTKVTGEKCPNCGGEKLQRQEGCIICPDCSWSKCV